MYKQLFSVFKWVRIKNGTNYQQTNSVHYIVQSNGPILDIFHLN